MAVCYKYPLVVELGADDTIDVDGRFCSGLLGISCCLPCPQTEWLYPDNFDTITKSASWVNVAGMICSMFLLISFAFLPVSKTHRHYLSICLAIATVFMQVSIPILPKYRKEILTYLAGLYHPTWSQARAMLQCHYS